MILISLALSLVFVWIALTRRYLGKVKEDEMEAAKEKAIFP